MDTNTDHNWRRNYRDARRRKKDTAIQQQPDKPAVLTLMIPTLPGREPYLNPLITKINEQIKSSGRDVELLVFLDNRRMTTGEKRNHMVRMAAGRYHAHLDDDDDITDDYVMSLIEAIEEHDGVDVITFDIMRLQPNGGTMRRTFHLAAKETWRCKLAYHLMAWRADVARQVQFPAVNMCDDGDWTLAINKIGRTEHHIDKVLYHYRIGYGGGWQI